VVGASTDSQKAQKKFRDALELPFPLLADEDKRLVQSYGVFKEKNMYGRKVMGIERTTFLIDGSGRINRVFSKVKPEGHATDVLQAIKDLKG
jgi:peroxiredoxin Q/BCP